MKILIVDDERLQRETLSAILSDLGHETVASGGVQEAVKELQSATFDLILTDFKMPDGSGLDVASKAKQLMPETLVFVMTAYAEVSSVIDAMRIGVADYFLKPLNVELLLRKIRLLNDHKDLLAEVTDLRARINATSTSTLLGQSDGMGRVRTMIGQVSETRGTVLITGESGTGKEVAARLIHNCSADSGKKFVAVNCAAIPENLIESELFGHKKGAFTGAVTDKEGLFKVASGGTIFLDEIGDLPKSMQAKLLRVIQEREITPVGDVRPIKVDLRVIAATNRDLAAAVSHGEFRQDLYYRINVVNLKMPALRENPEDIPMLAQHFIDKYVKEFSKNPRRLGNSAARALMQYRWPGNVRELENVIERAIILGGASSTLELEDLPESFVATRTEVLDEFSKDHLALNLQAATDLFTKRHIERVLTAVENDKKQAAKVLGLGLSSLYRKIDDLNISSRAGEQAKQC
jgi:DNA-binding NtrC family response regulator